MFTIRFCFENGDPVEASAQEGDNLLEIARRHNVAIDAPAPATRPAENAGSSC